MTKITNPPKPRHFFPLIGVGISVLKLLVMKPVSLHQSLKPAQSASRQTGLILCGVFSSVLYLLMNVWCAAVYPGYDWQSQTVSELSAIDAPTRPLWVSLAIIFSMLNIAFAWGVWLMGTGNKWLRFTAWLLFLNAFIGLFWPPMHQRSVIAAGGGTLTDTLHLVFAGVAVALMTAIIVMGAAAIKGGFRVYSAVTLFVLIFFGILTGIDSPGIEAGSPTPHIGIWERINIAAYMVWVAVFSLFLLKGQAKATVRRT